MTCKTIDLGPNVFAIVCSRGQKKQPEKVRYCVFCLRKGIKTRSSKLCDFRVDLVVPLDSVEIRAMGAKTCDLPMCEACAVRRGVDLDYCPDHEALEKSAMVKK